MTWILVICMAALANVGFGIEFPGFLPDAQPGITLTLPDEDSDDNGGQQPHLKLRIDPQNTHDADTRNNTRNEARRHSKPKSNKHEKYEKQEKHGRRTGAYQSGPYEVTGVRIVDINSGKVMPIETVDLKPTFDRIAAGIKHSHRNDGTVFRNLSHRLPRKARNYYREYVVPTKGIRGPGPQRLVLGEEGEAYYTYDHYDSFIKLERE